MKHELCVDLGTKATFFGLGLLASKKLRPYAKYFIIGGLALSAAPVIMDLVEKSQQKRIELEQQVDEVVVEDSESCCHEEQPCREENEECTEKANEECPDADCCAEEAENKEEAPADA